MDELNNSRLAAAAAWEYECRWPKTPGSIRRALVASTNRQPERVGVGDILHIVVPLDIASAVKYEFQTNLRGRFEVYSTIKYLTSLAYLLIISAAQSAPASRLRAGSACGKIAGVGAPVE